MRSVLGEGAGRLPESDDERLLFYGELVVANMAMLTADLSSAKYTFLSFSEKSRNEVRLKLALLQSIDRTLRDVIQTAKTLQDKETELQESEVRLVAATPPRFVAAAEAEREPKAAKAVKKMIESKPANDKPQTASPRQSGPMVVDVSAEDEQEVNEEEQDVEDVTPVIADAPSQPPPPAAVPLKPITLTEEDLQPIRAAEAALESETEALAELHKEVNRIEDELEGKHNATEQATRRVEGAKLRSDELARHSQYVEQKVALVSLLTDEARQRAMVRQDFQDELAETMQACREEELCLITAAIEKAKEQVNNTTAELEERRKRHEVELAAYQIAYKEEQAAADTLKASMADLRQRQRYVERLAKEQQVVESEQNSITRMFTKAWRSSTTRASEFTLTDEMEKQLRNDHALVSELAARISTMDEQRREVAGILVQAGDTEDDTVIKSAIDRIQVILQPSIEFDDNALSDEEGDDTRVGQ